MIINPKIITSSLFPDQIIPEKNIQPNGIDFNLDRVFKLVQTPGIVPSLSEEGKTFFNLQEILPDSEDYFVFEPNVVYDCSSVQHVTIDEGVASILLIRSTLNRLGMVLSAGLYDTGFNGAIGFTLCSRVGPVRIKKGTRVGQIVTWAAVNNGMYSGGYNHKQGSTWFGPYAEMDCAMESK